MNQELILYFGYGANRSREMMEAITGNKNLVGRPAVLKGYELCVQGLGQIPDIPRKIVEKAWSPKFTSYTIRQSQIKESEVNGTLWELTPLERELVRDWELVDLGWYKDHLVSVTTEGGQNTNVQTEILGDRQKVDRVVDGRNYPTFLNELSDFQRLARFSREEYFKRMHSKEGAFITPKERDNI